MWSKNPLFTRDLPLDNILNRVYSYSNEGYLIGWEPIITNNKIIMNNKRTITPIVKVTGKFGTQYFKNKNEWGIYIRYRSQEEKDQEKEKKRRHDERMAINFDDTLTTQEKKEKIFALNQKYANEDKKNQ